MFAPIALTPENAPALWRYLREELLRVSDATNSLTLPEEVYASWRSDQCSVFQLCWRETPNGIAVLKPSYRDDGCRELWVWALSFHPIADPQMVLEVNDWLRALAMNTGSKSIAMRSGRKGWGRYLEDLGWKPTLVEYSLEV
jgi:hypothetical protein